MTTKEVSVQSLIQSVAHIESLLNPIDRLAILDRQIKELTEQSKALKDEVANTYGEGKHRGEKYGVTVTLCKTATVDYKALLAELGVSDEVVEKFKKHGASIRVTVTA